MESTITQRGTTHGPSFRPAGTTVEAPREGTPDPANAHTGQADCPVRLIGAEALTSLVATATGDQVSGVPGGATADATAIPVVDPVARTVTAAATRLLPQVPRSTAPAGSPVRGNISARPHSRTSQAANEVACTSTLRVAVPAKHHRGAGAYACVHPAAGGGQVAIHRLPRGSGATVRRVPAKDPTASPD